MSSNHISQKSAHSERSLARKAGLSRTTLRALKEGSLNPRLHTLERLADARNLDLEIIESPRDSDANMAHSVPVIACLVIEGGFESWKIHFFNLVDEVRRSKDFRLLIAPPAKGLDPKLKALLAAITLELCKENGWTSPVWACREPRLKRPWFVSGSEALKASALVESTLRFKAKNIFVLENFLRRT